MRRASVRRSSPSGKSLTSMIAATSAADPSAMRYWFRRLSPGPLPALRDVQNDRVGGTHQLVAQMLPVPRKHLHCRPPAHLDRQLVAVQPLVQELLAHRHVLRASEYRAQAPIFGRQPSTPRVRLRPRPRVPQVDHDRCCVRAPAGVGPWVWRLSAQYDVDTTFRSRLLGCSSGVWSTCERG